MDFWRHLKTVQRHRRLVRQHCFRLGLYWQGLTHDLSKFSPVEFWAGVKYFQGDRSPNDAQRRARKEWFTFQRLPRNALSMSRMY